MEFAPQIIRFSIIVAIIATCRSFETKSGQLSRCLLEPIKGLVYRHTGRVESLSLPETGCYIIYGNGTFEWDDSPISHRKFFVVDTSGGEIEIKSGGNATISMFDQETETKEAVAEPETRSFRFDQLSFPKKCFAQRRYTRNVATSEPSSMEAATSSAHFGEIKDSDSQLFCSAGVATTEFKPFDGVRELFTGKIPETSDPYIQYSFRVKSRAIIYGCIIARPLNSYDSAFRYFYSEDDRNELNDTSIELISIGELGGEMQPPQRITIQDFCFPSSCYGPNEVQHCGSKIGKPYALTVDHITLFTDKKEKDLFRNIVHNKDIDDEDPSPLKALKQLIWREHFKRIFPKVTLPPISAYMEEFWRPSLEF